MTRTVGGKLGKYWHKSQGRTRFQDWAWSSVKNSREAKKDEDGTETVRPGQEKVITDLRRSFKGVRISVLQSTYKTVLGCRHGTGSFSFGVTGLSMKQELIGASRFHCFFKPQKAAYRGFEFSITL